MSNNLMLSLLFVFMVSLILLMGGDQVDKRTFITMKACVFNPLKVTKLEINGETYPIPLPDRAGKLNEKEYIALRTGSMKDFVDDYTKERMEPSGWRKYDQLGSGHCFISKDHKVRIVIVIRQYTKLFYRFTVNVI